MGERQCGIMRQEPVTDLHDGTGALGQGGANVARLLSHAIAERVSHAAYMRGVSVTSRLTEAISEKAASLAEIALMGADMEGDPTASDITHLAMAYSALVTDLPTENMLDILMPDPNLGPFMDALSVLESAAGKEGTLGTWRPFEDVTVEFGDGDVTEDAGGQPTDGMPTRRDVLQAVRQVASLWEALTPYGRRLAKVDKARVRRGLIASLGFEGYLEAERELRGMFSPYAGNVA